MCHVEFLFREVLSLLPHLFIYSVTYLYHYGLVDTYCDTVFLVLIINNTFAAWRHSPYFRSGFGEWSFIISVSSGRVKAHVGERGSLFTWV